MIEALLAAGILIGFGGRRLTVALKAGADPAHRYLSGFALLMGSSLVVLDPSNLTELGKAVPEVAAVLFGDALKTAAVSSMLLFSISLSPEPAGRIRRAMSRTVVVAIAVQLVSAALLSAARPGVRRGTLLAGSTSGRLLLSAYDALFTGYAVWCLIVLGRILVSHLRVAAPGVARAGLRLAVAAVAAATLWTAWSLDDISGILTRGTQDGGEDTLSNALGLVCVTLAVAAATVPLWRAPLVAPLRWLRAYRSYRALEPLWSALHSELPEIALTLSGPDRRIPLRHAEFALYRRIIEIRDGQLALRPYADPGPFGPVPATGGRPGSPAQAVHEAAVLTAALANYRRGRRHTGETDAALGLRPTAGTVEAEASWLVQVARAFAVSGSPAPRAAVRAHSHGD